MLRCFTVSLRQATKNPKQKRSKAWCDSSSGSLFLDSVGGPVIGVWVWPWEADGGVDPPIDLSVMTGTRRESMGCWEAGQDSGMDVFYSGPFLCFLEVFLLVFWVDFQVWLSCLLNSAILVPHRSHGAHVETSLLNQTHLVCSISQS